MSSTEYKVDRREILFMLNEVLHVGDLCNFPNFSEFDEEMFNMIVNEASTFAEKVLAPISASGDKQGCRIEEGTVRLPDGFVDAWGKLAEGGWIGLSTDIEVGGQGLPELISTATIESMFGANQALVLSIILSNGSANLIKSFGSEEQKASYCENMFTGKWAGTMCLTEPGSGSDLGDIKTTAIKKGDHYAIKGTKQFITSGEHDMTDNIIHLLLARTPDAPPGTKGISLLIVPKFRLDGTPNDVHIAGIEHKMGINGSATCSLSFGENDGCHGYLLNEENVGMKQMFQMMNEARMLVAIQGLSGAAAAVQFAQAYAGERLQGVGMDSGKNPAAPKVAIIEHPDVRRMLMSMKSVTEGLRGLLYTCALCVDIKEHGPEATREHYQNLLDIFIPVAKSFATDQGFNIACTGIQILGGVGFTKDFPLEQVARDLKITSIYEGTNGIQALDLISRKFQIKNGALVASLRQELEFFDKQENLPSTISKLAEDWNAYRQIMFDSMMGLRKLAEKGGPKGYVLYAVNMQELMGDVLCCFYLLKQALVAQTQFDKLATSAASKEALLENNTDARFYWNKICTAENYVYSILPRVLQHAKIIENACLSPLNAKL
ncbi:acyl-CoA dehydrogenase [Deltaproteobacteria bacterium TL4]